MSNQLVLAWSEPLENGGCPISGFAIYRDDSFGSDVDTEVNADNDASIRDNPILRQASVTNFPENTVGRYFRYKIEAFNREGSTDSSYVTLLNAGPPLAPTTAPVLDEQTDTYLKVSLPLVEAANNGGSDIISYSLQIDDGNGGDYVSVGGEDPISMKTDYMLANVTRGASYRLRYRVKNDVDDASWSEYSPVLFALAADVPDSPAPPTLASATADSITLTLAESSDSGGSRVLDYELWRDAGTYGGGFSQVSSYLGSLPTHTLTAASDGIASGTTYTF